MAFALKKSVLPHTRQVRTTEGKESHKRAAHLTYTNSR